MQIFQETCFDRFSFRLQIYSKIYTILLDKDKDKVYKDGPIAIPAFQNFQIFPILKEGYKVYLIIFASNVHCKVLFDRLNANFFQTDLMTFFRYSKYLKMLISGNSSWPIYIHLISGDASILLGGKIDLNPAGAGSWLNFICKPNVDRHR